MTKSCNKEFVGLVSYSIWHVSKWQCCPGHSDTCLPDTWHTRVQSRCSEQKTRHYLIPGEYKNMFLWYFYQCLDTCLLFYHVFSVALRRQYGWLHYNCHAPLLIVLCCTCLRRCFYHKPHGDLKKISNSCILNEWLSFTWWFYKFLVVDILLCVTKDTLDPVVLDVGRVRKDVGVVVVKIRTTPPVTVHARVTKGISSATKSWIVLTIDR